MTLHKLIVFKYIYIFQLGNKLKTMLRILLNYIQNQSENNIKFNPKSIKTKYFLIKQKTKAKFILINFIFTI